MSKEVLILIILREKLRDECRAEKREFLHFFPNPPLVFSARLEQATTGAMDSWLQ